MPLPPRRPRDEVEPAERVLRILRAEGGRARLALLLARTGFARDRMVRTVNGLVREGKARRSRDGKETVVELVG